MTGVSPRRRAREALFRALFQAEICGDPLRETWETLELRGQLPSDAQAYADALAARLGEGLPEVDAALRQELENWRLERLGATDRSTLRVAAAELLYRTETPARVVIDEAVEIAARFGGASSGAFVNGVLDRLARRVRPGELEASPVGEEGRS